MPAAAASETYDNLKDEALPYFDFHDYPKFDDEGPHSPRIGSETWTKYEKMSKDEVGATNLRHESQFLDMLIHVFQYQPEELREVSKRHAL